MDLDTMVWDALAKAMEAEGRRLEAKAHLMRPVVWGDLPYVTSIEYGQRPNTIDSTAVVIDDSMKALPEPKKGR